jgi:hypothetical protein
MQVSGDGYEQLNDAIAGASFEYVHMKSKADIVSYYKETYTGRGAAGWKQHIIKDVSAQTGVKPSSIERRFDPSRIDRMSSSESQKQYTKLGETLPMKKQEKNVKGKRARVNFQGEVCVPSGKKGRMDCRQREFSVMLSPAQANNMRQGNYGVVFDAYGLNPGIISEISVDNIGVDFL